MEHLHHQHGQAKRLTSLNYTYYIAIGLNLAFVILEALIGLSYNSLGLLSDAGHKLLDVFSLLIALVAFKLTASRPTKRYTYGFRKTSVLISLFNALVLMAAVCVIIAESIEKLGNPVEVSGAAISWTAGAGIIVSGLSALLLMRHQKGDINTRGAFLRARVVRGRGFRNCHQLERLEFHRSCHQHGGRRSDIGEHAAAACGEFPDECGRCSGRNRL